MSFLINDNCTQCGLCEMECTKDAIVDKLNRFEIKSLLCDDCEEFEQDYEDPPCVTVCPVSAIIHESELFDCEDLDCKDYDDLESKFENDSEMEDYE